MTKGEMKQMLQPAHNSWWGSGALDAIIWAHLLHNVMPTFLLITLEIMPWVGKIHDQLSKKIWLKHVEDLAKLKLNKNDTAGPKQMNLDECAVISVDPEHLN